MPMTAAAAATAPVDLRNWRRLNERAKGEPPGFAVRFISCSLEKIFYAGDLQFALHACETKKFQHPNELVSMAQPNSRRGRYSRATEGNAARRGVDLSPDPVPT